MAQDQPDDKLAARVLPAGLYSALRHVFAQRVRRCMLVGGTALAGYYAGHRRSDDLDLFAADAGAFRAAVLAVGSLRDIGTAVEARQSTPQFFDALCSVEEHTFTAQVVLDPNVFAVGRSVVADDGVAVADLSTLLKQKLATLVSRCSEKDLYDLSWLFGAFPELHTDQLVELGREVDGGMTAETALISLAGTTVKQSACGFSVAQSEAEAFRDVTALKRQLERVFHRLAKRQPAGAVGDLIRALRK